MRLSTIKLSGFKSFVDPTTLHLPTNMTGVVGPNGCGKSNIIDAVRWVMGESSASRLRGDSLTDVIFSGSAGRKPVSQATVELIFDNTDHTIAGEYASFNEISVKRTVSRDGSSNYYLNGTKCRRRDITDLFLGTGLGPRSYSIIEQGMISQIIEARPEDLRVYLEEAAGISKYKERRKETETRIRHTRENLDRLNDLREEIGKQLEHLRRQARQAEQYQALQEERRVKDAEWKALEYRGLDARLGGLREALAREETRLQQLVAEQREAESRIETGRVRREEAAETLSRAQADVYQVGSTLARLEQQIQHQREMAQRLHKARDETRQALAELGQHISGDEARLMVLREAVENAEPQLEQLQEENEFRQEGLREAEAALHDWQQRWEAHNRNTSEATRSGEVERTRVDYLDRQILEADRRREALAAERAGLDVEALAEAFEQLQLQHESQAAVLDELNEQVELRKEGAATLQERQRASQAELAEVRKQAQAARGRLSSLETLQQAALGQEQGAAVAWLKAHGLDSAARVGERISVESGWENAVESALGQLIEGVLVEAPEALVDALGELGEGRIALVSGAEGSADFAPTSLAARVQGPLAIRRLLARRTWPPHASCSNGWTTAIRSSPATASAWARAGCGCRGRGRPSRARCCASARSSPCAGRSRNCRSARASSNASSARSANSCWRPSSSARKRSGRCTRRIAVCPSWPGRCRASVAGWNRRVRASSASRPSLRSCWKRWTPAASRPARPACAWRTPFPAWATWRPRGRRWRASAAS